MNQTTPHAIQAWIEHHDETAATWLVSKYRPQVRRALVRWLPGTDSIEDAEQEVFRRVFRALPRFDLNGIFEAWLSTIACHVCWNVQRDRTRRMAWVFSGADNGEDLMREVPDEQAPCGLHRLMQCDDEAVMTRLIANLTVQDQSIVWLHVAEGLSADEVGQQVGLSPGLVRVRAHRAQKKLRQRGHHWRQTGSL